MKPAIEYNETRKAGDAVKEKKLIHDSHSTKYRNPFGAAVCSSEIELCLSGELLFSSRKVSLRVWQDDRGESLIEMKPQNEKKDFYYATIKSPSNPCLLWYYFIIETDNEIYYYGNNKERLGGIGNISREIPISYQMTVYKEMEIPKWYLSGVMYQIFPDRFYNGLENGAIRNDKTERLIHGKWEDEPLYIKDPSKGNVMKWDFFGGNLEGILEKLDYLKELGITIIYLNPIFEAASNHRYDTGDYRKIDPMLGSEELFEKLCKVAEQKGISIILDGVFSHTGSDSRYFNKEGNYDSVGAYQSKNSPYYPWYRFMEHPDHYDCWWGVDTMPNINEMEHSYRNFIYEDQNSVIRYWIQKGAAGWRLDVADELPSDFIKGMSKAVKQERKDAVLIGEVWEDASNKVSHGEKRQYLLGEELDSVMNYPFRNIVLAFLLGSLTGYEVDAQFMSLYENYPPNHFYSCMNLIGSHDRTRVLTRLGEAPDPNTLTETQKMQYKLSERERRIAVDRYKLASLFQMTFPGVPSIYYGDEAGIEGFSDPLNRRTYPWGKEDEEMIQWTKKVIKIRRQFVALQEGEWEKWLVGERYYTFLRKYGDEVILVVINAGTEAIELTGKMSKVSIGRIIDLLDDHCTEIQGNEIRIHLPALSGKAYLLQA